MPPPKSPRPRLAKPPQTTAQRLDSIVKSARKIMRKDKGLNGDLDRLPVLTWILFLKFLDDMERLEEEKAALAGKDHRGAIEAPYRWRDWAAPADGITGDDLLRFINAEEWPQPDGTRRPGLFAYLRGLRGADGRRDRRDVVSTVFRTLTNRMESGYLLRDIVNLVNGIHFDSSEEIHVLGRLYESLLKEMRDAAGDAGEFYTPRAVVRFMVTVTDPKLGEHVLDPACGTGGFLCEAFTHLSQQTDTVERRWILQNNSVSGCEAKALPYLLAQMNLLLHGMEAPEIDLGNALRFRLSDIGEEERVEVILTNPPFGGEEEAGILNNFPENRRSTETALLFLQLIMRRLKRGGRGRAGVVVPNGLLFGDGIAFRIKEDLLSQFNLHTVVRLPEGAFAPYTDIPSNLLFFDTTGPTRTIWFYEIPPPEGRRKYSKTNPLPFEAFAECLEWWQDRRPGPRAWVIDFAAEKTEALRLAEPHWKIASDAESRAAGYASEARRLVQELRQGNGATNRAALEACIADHQTHAAAAREEAVRARKAGDDAYWPIHNLDRKNPHAVVAADHRSSTELVESIIDKERQVLALMEELRALVTEIEE